MKEKKFKKLMSEFLKGEKESNKKKFIILLEKILIKLKYFCMMLKEMLKNKIKIILMVSH
jgi:hypothetical protein